MKRFIINTVALLAIVATTAFATYRFTMTHISVRIESETAYLTVYDQTDVYEMLD